jgi:nitrite reductase/ring-hydroxylating ferredoxin subunit
MEKQNLSRYEFLKTMGFRGAALMAVLTSCVKEEDMFVDAPVLNANGVAVANPAAVATATNTGGTNTGGTNTGGVASGVKGTSTTVTTTELNALKNVLIKVDLAATTSKNLLTVGGYIIQSNVVLALVGTASYAAVENLCTHEPKRKIIWNKTQWYCTDHGATFETVTAKPINNVARTAIKVYKVATDGKTVVVYS